MRLPQDLGWKAISESIEFSLLFCWILELEYLLSKPYIYCKWMFCLGFWTWLFGYLCSVRFSRYNLARSTWFLEIRSYSLFHPPLPHPLSPGRERNYSILFFMLTFVPVAHLLLTFSLRNENNFTYMYLLFSHIYRNESFIFIVIFHDLQCLDVFHLRGKTNSQVCRFRWVWQIRNHEVCF